MTIEIPLAEYGFDLEEKEAIIAKIPHEKQTIDFILKINLIGCLIDYQDAPAFFNDLFIATGASSPKINTTVIFTRDEYTTDANIIEDIFIAPLTESPKNSFTMSEFADYCSKKCIAVEVVEQSETGKITQSWPK